MSQSLKTVRQCEFGNTTVEYALSGMLICLVSVGALLAFSGAFTNKVSDLKTDMQANANASQGENSGSRTGNDLPTAGMPGFDNNNNLGITGANSGDKPFTTGANGNILGSTNQSGTGNLSEDGTVTPQQQSIVTQISNNAHEVARLQELLKTLAKFSKGNREIFRTTTIVYKGLTLNAAKIARLLDKDGMTGRLEKLLQRLESTGVDSEIADAVNDFTSQVSENAQSTYDTTQDVLANQPGATPANVVQNTDPEDTHQKAEKICRSSGGDDDGKNCRGGRRGKNSRDSRRGSRDSDD